MSSKNEFYWCIVPTCRNTGKSTPEKIFINVPLNSVKRKNWLDACGNKTHYSSSTRLYCCEDHFDLKVDLENWLEWTMVGGNKRMRNNVIPHKFIEQSKSLSMGDRSRENPQAPSMKVDKVGTEAMDLNIVKLRLDQNLGSIMDDLHSDLSNFNTPEDFQKNESNVCDDPPATGGQKLHVGVQVKIRSSYRSVKVQCKPVTKDRSSSPIEQLVDDINAHNFISQPANNDQLLNPFSI